MSVLLQMVRGMQLKATKVINNSTQSRPPDFPSSSIISTTPKNTIAEKEAGLKKGLSWSAFAVVATGTTHKNLPTPVTESSVGIDGIRTMSAPTGLLEHTARVTVPVLPLKRWL